MTNTNLWALVIALVALAGCTSSRNTGHEVNVATDRERLASVRPEQARWWESLRALEGQAFEGALIHGNASDTSFAGQRLVMHVRAAGERRMEIPFHVGEDRSRTWVLTRSEQGIELEHDHRHEDGTDDVLTMYGGDTTEPGTATAQHFPADAYSKELFDAQAIPQSKSNVWSMEIVPGERFSYALRREGRHFQVDFDLTEPIAPPPPPWGHE